MITVRVGDYDRFTCPPHHRSLVWIPGYQVGHGLAERANDERLHEPGTGAFRQLTDSEPAAREAAFGSLVCRSKSWRIQSHRQRRARPQSRASFQLEEALVECALVENHFDVVERRRGVGSR